MREILFRGKRIDNGEWIEGYYCNYETTCVGGGVDKHHRIVPYFASSLYGFKIDPSTVGQYTGLTDKNGKKIFEGDIVKALLSGKPSYGVVEYGKTGICAYCAMSHCEKSNYVLTCSDDFEVIGNIHDNPELMEAANNE